VADPYAGLDPAFVTKIKQLRAMAFEEGIPLALKEGYRTPERQAQLYAQGRTAPGAIITYAKPGQSRHQHRRAMDVVPLKDGKPDEESPHWGRIGELGKSLGLVWGGDFQRLNDRFHFELPPDRGPGRAEGASPARRTAATPGTIPGLERVTPAFRAKVDQVAKRLRMDPQHLLTVMSFETAGTFDPAKRNEAGSGATGLIQFLPKTARQLGTSTDALARMSPEEQLDYVEQYLRPYAGRMTTQQDAYLAVLNPSAMGKPASHVLFTEGTPQYELNKALDKEQKGRVTVGDTLASVGRFMTGLVTPARAEAAPPGPSRRNEPMPSQAELDDLKRQIQARRQQLQQQAAPAPAATPSAPPAAAPVAAPAAPSWQQRAGQAAWQAVGNLPFGQIPALMRPVLQSQYGQHLERLPQMGAAEGITTTGAMLGQAAGTLAAPYAGPLGPALPLVGRATGSYLGRQLNVALGLEEPGTLGDVLSVAGPAAQEVPGMVRAFRTGTPHQVPAGATERVTAAAEANVPLTYGEAVDQPMARRVETALEQVPLVGTGGFRTRQQAAVKAAAQAEVDYRQAVMQDTRWQGLPQVQAAAAQGNKQAQRVLDEVQQAGDDWNRIVQASGNLKAFRAKQVAERLYGRVGELAEGLGNVPMTKTLATIDDTLTELRTAVVPDTETIRYLEQLKSGLQGQTSTAVSGLLDAAGNPVTRTVTTPGKTTYRQLRQLRSDLGDTISDYYRGSNAVVGAKGVGSVAKVRNALDQDLDTFALQSPNPELAAAAKRADRYYKQQVVPYEDTQLAKALTSDTPDEIYGKFIQRGKGDRAQKFYNALDPKGKAAVQYGMIAEAHQQALDPTTGVFSPQRFAGRLDALQDAYGVVFTGNDKWKLDGLKKVMKAAHRAGQYAENPPTGQRIIPWLLGGGLAAGVTSPGTVVGAAATAKGLSWLLTSPTGTRFLLNAHRVAEDSAQMDRVLRELTTQGARLLATEGGERLQEGTQVQVEPGRVGR
jgi:hypothetical protein